MFSQGEWHRKPTFPKFSRNTSHLSSEFIVTWFFCSLFSLGKSPSSFGAESWRPCYSPRLNMMHPKVGPKVLPHQPLNPTEPRRAGSSPRSSMEFDTSLSSSLVQTEKLTARKHWDVQNMRHCQLQNIFFWSFIPGRKQHFLVSNMKIFRYSLVTRNLCRNASLRQLSSKWLTTHFSTFWCYVWKAWFFVLQFVFFVRVFP